MRCIKFIFLIMENSTNIPFSAHLSKEAAEKYLENEAMEVSPENTDAWVNGFYLYRVPLEVGDQHKNEL